MAGFIICDADPGGQICEIFPLCAGRTAMIGLASKQRTVFPGAGKKAGKRKKDPDVVTRATILPDP
jgi:hypothetical protein